MGFLLVYAALIEAENRCFIVHAACPSAGYPAVLGVAVVFAAASAAAAASATVARVAAVAAGFG